jgi:2',3'-cyclic-nucleotide 2'-phosphodiesterase (5'-nucleotidase family)
VVIFATGRDGGNLSADRAAGVGGFAVFKRLYDSETRPKLAVDLGGWMPSTPEGRLSRGRPAAACLAALPYAAAAPGFQEFSLSPLDLQRLAEEQLVTPLLASNLYLKSNKKPPFLRSYALAQAGGRKIGFLAVAINSPAKPNTPKHLPNYRLEKESYEAERAIRALKEAGAQLTVMLLTVNPKEKAEQAYFKDFLAKLPRVDLVITDEPTLKKPFRAGKAWVAPAGLGLAHAARLTLTLESQSGRVTALGFKNLQLDAGKYGEDPAMLKVIAGYSGTATAHFAKRVGVLKAPLPLREGDLSPAADFAADCMRRWARTNAAIIGLSEPAAGLPAGPVTLGDLHHSFPLDSSVVFVKIRGDDLERALSGLNPAELSVSGLRLFLRDGALERAEGENGPLVPGKVYHLAVPDSLVSGRENPVLSSAMEFANSRRSLREVIGWCFSRQSSFSKPAGGRIIKAVND